MKVKSTYKTIEKVTHFLRVLNGILLGLLGIHNNLVLVPVRIKRTRFNR